MQLGLLLKGVFIMKPIDRKKVEKALRTFENHSVYIHSEVTPGGFSRNILVQVTKCYIMGDGPFRVTLKLSDQGWIRIEGLTDYVHQNGQLLLAGHDEKGRLRTGLEISLKPFPA